MVVVNSMEAHRRRQQTEKMAPPAAAETVPAGTAKSKSRIFGGNRVLGYVSNQVPLVTRFIRRRREHLVATCVGRSFQTYGSAKLGLLSSSPIHPEDISCLAADSFMVYTGSGRLIYAWRRGTELKHTYKGHQARVVHLLPFGPQLVSVDEESVVNVWNIKDETLSNAIELGGPDSFAVTSICHPNTYKDKVLMGSFQGTLQLWNIKNSKKVYSFKGWGSPVMCLEPCPSVLDAVAVGLESGEIVVHNLKYDEVYIKFKQECGPVLSLSFRTDRTDILVSGSTSGNVWIWNLNEKCLAGEMREAHRGAVTGLACLPTEPLLMTSSPDNTVKQWIFDLPDGAGRLLRIREGHSAPPIRIRHYGALGSNILSASEDSTLRSFSTVADLLHKNFGVASYNRKGSRKHKRFHDPAKMAPIVDFTTDTTKDKEWDNIACIHRSTQVATTWSFGHQRMGDLKLRHPRFKEVRELRNAVASCLSLTACGNFVLVGYSSGHLDKFNIQSGIHRGELADPAGGLKTLASSSEVRGVVSDALNQFIVSGDAGGALRFWKFDSHRLYDRLETPAGVLRMELHRENSFLAVATADFGVAIYDASSRNLVRNFDSCHGAHLNDICLTSDCRWLLTASLDSTVKVWDVSSGALVDHIRFPSPVVSLSVSPNLDSLATAHIGDLGIYLWTNLSLFSTASLRPLGNDLDDEGWTAISVQMPSVVAGQQNVEEDPAETEDMVEDDDDDQEDWRSEQIGRLVTLANLPSSKWGTNLLNIEVIRARNKPREPAKKPLQSSDAPFFLPTLPGTLGSADGKVKFLVDDEEDPDELPASSSGKVLLLDLSQFGKELWKFPDLKPEARAGAAGKLMESLEACGPSGLELELRRLGPEGGGSHELLWRFLDLLGEVLASRRHFEAAQSYLALFLKIHGCPDLFCSSEDTVEKLRELAEVQNDSWVDLGSEVSSCLSLVSFCKSSAVSATD